MHALEHAFSYTAYTGQVRTFAIYIYTHTTLTPHIKETTGIYYILNIPWEQGYIMI